MQGNIDHMMHTGVEAEKLAVQRVREPGQWMPVRLLETCECPTNRWPGDSGLDVCVSRYIPVVVPKYEVEPMYWSIDDCNEENQPGTNRNIAAHV